MSKLSIIVFLISILFTQAFAQQGQNPGSLIGQDTLNRNITTAVPFLTITPDARAAGMGDLGVATSADVNSAFWNAGKLAFINNETGYGVSASYTPWLGKIINDMSIFYLSGFYKISREQTVAASMKYFDLGEIEFRDGANVSLGRFNPREFAFDVAYSRLLTENFSIGGALRYIHSNLTGAFTSGTLDARPGNSVAVDMGVYYTKPMQSSNSTLTLGGAITNIGSKISYSDATNKDFIPTNMRLGGAYKTDLDPKNSITFALELNKLLVPSPRAGSKSEPLLSGIFSSFTDARGGFEEEIHEIMTSVGVEYWYDNFFALRAGYFLEAKDKGNRKYMTSGVGLRYNKFGADIAYLVPTNRRENPLAETLRLTVMMNFAKKVKESESVTDSK